MQLEKLEYYLVSETDFTISQTNLPLPENNTRQKCYEAILGYAKPCFLLGKKCPVAQKFTNSIYFERDDLKAVGIRTSNVFSTKIETEVGHYFFNYLTDDYNDPLLNPFINKQITHIITLLTKNILLQNKLDTTTSVLNKNKKEFDLFFEKSPLAFLLFNEESQILSSNPAACELFGYSKAEFKQKKLYDILARNYHKRYKTSITSFLKHGSPKASVRRQFVTKFDQKIWLSVDVTKITDNKFVTFCKDITDEKKFLNQLQKNNAIMEQVQQKQARLIDELYEAKEEAETSSKLKANFLRNLSHEIRTPLNGIIGFSDLIKQNMPPEKHQQFLTIIKDSGKQLLNVINDIIDISIIESNQLRLIDEEIDIIDLLRDAYDFQQSVYQAQIQQGIKYKLEIDEQYISVFVKTDKTRLQQIIKALTNNAFKFTHDGQITIGCRLNKDELDIFIADTGIGIDPKDFQKILEPFRQVEQQLSRRYGGSGIGLSIVKGIVEKMNFQLKIQSRLNHGSTFSIAIPSQRITKLEKTPLNITNQTQPKKQILLVEDNLQNAELTQIILNDKYTLTTLTSGEEALQYEGLLKTDLILMDIRLPGIDGIETTKKIKQRYPYIPVVMLTAHALTDMKQKAYDAGAELFLTKPINALTLNDEIARLLAKIT